METMKTPPTITLRIGPAEISIDAAAHDELTNWGQWQAQRTSHGGRRAGSAEGRYRAELPGSAGAARVDPQRALTVERTIGNPEFPRQAALLLRHQYVLHADPRATARIAGVRWTDLGSAFQRAVWTARNRARW
jgi:hypothetical protein